MQEDKSSIERLKKKLYSRSGEGIGPKERSGLHELHYDTPSQWKDVMKAPKLEKLKPRKEEKSLFTKLLIISGTFFVLSLLVSLFFFFGGSNVVSSKNVDIEIQGPTTIGGGEELVLQVSVTNRNTVPINLADLLIEYPEGTRSATDLGTELPRHRESLKNIGSGKRVEKTIRSVLFGEENSQKTIKITVEYRVDGSNAIFFAEHEYEITISSSPLSLSVSSFDEVISGQDMEIDVTITSNSSTVIENVLLVLEYPFGFELLSSNPRSFFGDTVWDLGDIQPQGKRTVTIRGKMIGEDEEERVFRFSSGIQSENDEKKLEAAFITYLQAVTIKKPFMSAELTLNGDDSLEDYVFGSGKQVRGEITLFNNLPVNVADAEIQLKFRGNALDKFTVTADNGFYRSSDNTIIWNRETNGAFASLSPGESKRVGFSFSSLGLSSGVTLRNPEVSIEINIKGKRLTDAQVPETIRSSLVRTVKISSDLLLSPRAVYFSGPFVNIGPMPPRVNSETTYTIIWTVTNVQNAVAGAQVVATLPPYVRWMGEVSPSNESVNYNSVEGKVIWDIGEIESGGGSVDGSQKEVAFKIGMTPSISQIGSAPVLINQHTVSGFDRFAEVTIENGKSPLTTLISTDPNFKNGQEAVTQ